MLGPIEQWGTALNHGLTPKQIADLDEFIHRKLNALSDQLQHRSLLVPTPAPPSAPPPAPKLPLLPPTSPPAAAYAPPSSTDTLKEVEYKQASKSLRNVKQPIEAEAWSLENSASNDPRC